ncbi:MAG: hypothetical protein KO463_00620 [Candidatus Methanofastidiosa archaeon]|nr:hypothetical protein [Candidatus Methanofastidiosa archaeon]
MDSDNSLLPEGKEPSFIRRNAKFVGIIVLLILLISALFVVLRTQGNDIDPEFARNNAFLPEYTLQSWHVMYLSESSLYYMDVYRKLSDTEYEILDTTTGETHELTFFEAPNEETGATQWHLMVDDEVEEAIPILIYFDVKDFVGTDTFTLIQETVSYPYLDTIYLLFGAWEEPGVENQQLAYGMSSISEAVGMRVGDTDKIVIEEITDDHFIDLYKREIGTPTHPVIYVMTAPYGAMKNNVVIPYDGAIVVEVPNYEQLRLFCLVVGQMIAPTGGAE